eukprot:s2849_g4.t1
MPGSKRTLTPRFTPAAGNGAAGPPPPLREGFAIRRKVTSIPGESNSRELTRRGSEPTPYGRGSAADALALAVQGRMGRHVRGISKAAVLGHRAQLEALLRSTTDMAKDKIACPSPAMLHDCEASVGDIEPPKPADKAIINENGNKVHRALVYGDDIHPREWKTRCGWHFGGPHTVFRAVPDPPDDRQCCRKCYPKLRQPEAQESATDSSNSSSTSSSS